jgi:hypothetical protein
MHATAKNKHDEGKRAVQRYCFQNQKPITSAAEGQSGTKR